MSAGELASNHLMNAQAKFAGMLENLHHRFGTQAVVGDDALGSQRLFAHLKLRLNQQNVVGFRGDCKNCIGRA